MPRKWTRDQIPLGFGPEAVRPAAEPDPPPADGRAAWILLATDRRVEHNAEVFALGPNGGVRAEPPYAEFPDRARAEAELAFFRRDGVLDDSRYTYTPFRPS